MRAPFRNDPRDPWDDDEIPAIYKPSYAVSAWPESPEVDDAEPAVPFGFQVPARRRSIDNPSRQARALMARSEREDR